MSIIKPKIAIVTNDFLVGGIQKLVIDQVRLLEGEYEFVIIVLMQFPSQGDFYHLVPDGVKVYKLNFNNFWDVSSWLSLINILLRERPAIVKTAMFFSNTVIRVLKPFLGYRVITAEHNTEASRPFLQRLINRIFALYTYTIIADSNTVAQFIHDTEKIPLRKLTTIYNGVEIAAIHDAMLEFGQHRSLIRSEMRVADDDIVFLSVIRLVAQKNPLLMIEGFAQFISNGGSGKLVIIGDGKLRPLVEQKIKQHALESRVFLMGERQDIYRFYSAADFFVLTSIREGFCISAMNGLAFGLPLISTKVAGVIEYLRDGENGYLIESNPAAFAHALHKVSNLPVTDIESMKRAAQNTAKRFSVEAHAEAYRALFNACLGS